MRKLYYGTGFILLILLQSCISSIRISVKKPAPVNLPETIQKVVVVNNSMIEREDKSSTIEGILSGEIVEGDKIAAEQCVKGVVQQLLESNAYTATSLADIPLRQEHETINWEKIQKVCDSHSAQVLVVLDYFDSNAPAGGVVVSNLLGQPNSSIQGEAYFTIYYPKKKLLKERIRVTDVYYLPTSGSPDPLSMANDVVRKHKYVKSLGYNLGKKAARMLYPKWIWVDREYYGSGNDDLRQAKRMIKEGHWDMAEEKLRPLLDDPKEKIRQRATFNLALVNEGQGELDKAIKMARKAAKKYDDKHAYEYINVLENRKAELREIEWQGTH